MNEMLTSLCFILQAHPQSTSIVFLRSFTTGDAFVALHCWMFEVLGGFNLSFWTKN
ncbi:hypothetical protein BDN72DRAFT_907170 [Pluteus cervinus]|uniref:Uncharacterized protein n=1 Tax=Pluteus cervinus TaxID=181527 RepID=A0ACD2ZXA7_9AGAR|nr:hypothetical protein BDN72DRAFT_907170 [Pluteus cervinus]